MNRKDITKQLQQMAIPELVAVFRDAFATHHPGTSESGVTDDRYVLAVARREIGSDHPADAAPSTLEAVAYPDPAVYGNELGPEWGLCQSGTCATCSLVVRSNIKHGLCPSCGMKVYLT